MLCICTQRREMQLVKNAASGGLWLPADPLRHKFCSLKLYHDMYKFAMEIGPNLEKSPKSTGHAYAFWR